MRKLFLFVIALGLILDSCGGGLDMTMKSSKGFKVKSSVDVESNGFDPASLQQKIERALFENGVNVESPSLTQGGTVLQHDLMSQAGSLSPGKTTDSVSAGSSVADGREKSSVYLLEFTYESNYTFSGVVITDFTATVFNAGEIVGMISYHGGQTTADKLAENVGKKLAQELK
jgi:hypothetical protein